jgi:superfamily II RNA helicase
MINKPNINKMSTSNDLNIIPNQFTTVADLNYSLNPNKENLGFLSKYTNLDPFQITAFECIEKYNSKLIDLTTQSDLSIQADPLTQTDLSIQADKPIQTNQLIKYDENTQNILITAHTGSGKSLPAEYGIYHTIKTRKQKVIYTSPIKSLSNQKFDDFNKKFSEYGISIGILTGDIKFAPHADCIIMTTEILLNQLLKYLSKSKSDTDIDFSEVGCIIFDEVHYINDTDRGNVWEQSIMYIPNHIQLIMLSATLNEPEKFGKWIESVQNKPTKIISTTHRVVPLSFSVYYSMTQGLIKKLPKDKTKALPFNELIQLSTTSDKKFDDLMYQRILKFNEFQLKQMNGNKFYASSIINEMLKVFNHENYEENMFPLLFFVLNKKKCIELAKSINTNFNTGKEASQVDSYITKIVGRDSPSNISPFGYLHQMEQFSLVRKLATKGIGIHHSGLLPILKEIVEQLYEMKLIKVLFATETFAVGLNMPTKTVVFCDLGKYSNDGHRLLHSHEFIQMAGRAGRRNIDTKGYIILLPQLFRNQLTTTELTHIMYGGGQKIVSKLNIDELLILRLLKANSTDSTDSTDSTISTTSADSTDLTTTTDLRKLTEYVKHSMLADNTKSQIKHQQTIVDKLKITIDTISISEEDDKLIQELISLTNPFFSLNKKQNERLKELSKNLDLMSKFKTYDSYQSEMAILNDLVNCIEISVQHQLDHLFKHNMIEYDGSSILLTNRGVIGSYVIDQNPIIIADIIMSDFFKRMIQPLSKLESVIEQNPDTELEIGHNLEIGNNPDTKELLYNLISLFSTLTFDDRLSDSIDICGFIEQNKSNQNIMWKDFIGDLLRKYHTMGESALIDKFNFDYVWFVDQFVRTSVYPTTESEPEHLFEGNFVRSANRLLNLLNEITNIAQITENKGLMNIFEECRLELFQGKNWLIPDSIYLRKCGFVIQSNGELINNGSDNSPTYDGLTYDASTDIDEIFSD